MGVNSSALSGLMRRIHISVTSRAVWRMMHNPCSAYYPQWDFEKAAMLPSYLTSAFHLDSEDGPFPWTENDVDRLYQARMELGSLVIDLILRDAGIACTLLWFPYTGPFLADSIANHQCQLMFILQHRFKLSPRFWSRFFRSLVSKEI